LSFLSGGLTEFCITEPSAEIPLALLRGLEKNPLRGLSNKETEAL
jgi:hypothetical protein